MQSLSILTKYVFHILSDHDEYGYPLERVTGTATFTHKEVVALRNEFLAEDSDCVSLRYIMNVVPRFHQDCTVLQRA